MTYTNKIYEFILRKKKVLLTSLIMVITVFTMLNMGNVYAIEVEGTTDGIDLQEAFKSNDKSDSVIGNDENKNVLKLTTNQTLAFFAGLVKAGGGSDLYKSEDQRLYAELSEGERTGLLGVVTENVNALMFNPPNVNVIAHLSEEWVPGYAEQNTSVYAESGYQYLKSSGLSGLWNYFRNIAYILFVVVMIVAGFMVMFRKKIGGQLLVTVYNTIPRVILGLILVTFSFAIVGIVIDIGSMLINVASAALISLSGGELSVIPIDGPFALMDFSNTGAYTTALAESIDELGPGKWVAALLAAFPIILSMGIVLIVVAFAFIAILIFASIRVYITLLKSYLALIIDLILAPVFIAFGAFPGSQATMNWFKRVVKNVLVFVMVFFFVNLGFALITADINLAFPSGLAAPGTAVAATGDDAIGFTIKLLLPILLMFFAADAPKMIEDFLPSNGGKGFAGAMEAFKGGLQKIPLFGGMVK